MGQRKLIDPLVVNIARTLSWSRTELLSMSVPALLQTLEIINPGILAKIKEA